VTTQTFVIPITDNEVKDGARTFGVFLTPGTAGTAISSGGSATVTIQDND
jgi:hypothetical protein